MSALRKSIGTDWFDGIELHWPSFAAFRRRPYDQERDE